MPVFMTKYNEHKIELGGNELLGTIKIPKNLSLLAERLPKAQYEVPPPLEEVDEEPIVKMSELENLKRIMNTDRHSIDSKAIKK